MAWTVNGKLVMANAFVGTIKYIALFIGNVELSGHGYTRGSVVPASMSVNNSTARITVGSAINIYTPTDASAQDATHIAIYDSATGGNQLLEPTQFTDIPAPQQGQTVQVPADMLTIDP